MYVFRYCRAETDVCATTERGVTPRIEDGGCLCRGLKMSICLCHCRPESDFESVFVLVWQRLMLQPEIDLNREMDMAGELAVDIDSATFAWEKPVSIQTKAQKGPYYICCNECIRVHHSDVDQIRSSDEHNK